MNSSTIKVRALLILLFISVLSFSNAVFAQTEYEGILVIEGQADDRRWGPLPIGFDFDFFGTIYNEFFVSSNGLVLFGAGSNLFSNVGIPHGARPDNFIAPFWDDLIVHKSGDIMYQTLGTAPNRRLVVQFSNMSFWTSTVLLGTIQVILYEGSNNIRIQYNSIVDRSSDRASGNSATIGLENVDGTTGVECSYNTAGYVYSGRSILFTPNGGSYTFDENATYENILLVNEVPRAGIPELISPAHISTVGETVTFKWEAASYASAYYVEISQNADLSSPVHTSADQTDLNYEYTLVPDQTYYWSVAAKNSVESVSWSEIWSFQTSSNPPFLALPQKTNVEQGDQKKLNLQFSGGDTLSKTATVVSLPAEGVLYQSNGSIPGARISTVPADLSDIFHNVFYEASGATGNGVGSFDFYFTDETGTSTTATYTVNVSPPGIPNFQYASRATDRVEITFDRPMTDPSGFHLEFAVEDNGVAVASSSCNLKAGDPSTIVVYVSPGLNTVNAITVAYTRGSITAANGGILESFDFQLAGKLAQTISFNVLPDRTYGNPDFTLSASSSSALPLTFSSSNSTVVSVAGTMATINNAGETVISAFQAGDDTYAAVSFDRPQVVNKANAMVSLSNLNQAYTGSGLSVAATTNPAGLDVHISYDGSTTLPVDTGNHAVLAEIVETNYSGSASGTLIISDYDAPIPDVPALPVLTDECSVTPLSPTATDLYAGSISGMTGTPFPITTQGTTVITWTYSDGNGNTSSQTQNVVIDDVSAPVTPSLADLALECSSDTANAPTTTDACAGTITGNTPDPLYYSSPGIYVINWTFDDGNGNIADATQNVLVTDNTPPEATVPADVTTCDGRVSAIGLIDVKDNCSTAPIVNYELSGATTGSGSGDATVEIFAPGITTVTYTVEDGNGNSSQYQLSVTYQPAEDVVVTLADGALTCETTGTYQWISCSDNSIIDGETSNTFRPGVNGEYAVILTQGVCSDTSDCYTLDYTGLNEAGYQDYKIYPNPAHEKIIIDMAREHTNVSIKIFDMTGNLLKMQKLDRVTEMNLDISEFKTGMYMIHIHSDQLDSVSRIIKE